MKRSISAVLLALCLLLCCVSVRAEELWSEDYYRAWDDTDTLSDEEIDSLDGDCIDFMRQYHQDLVLIAVSDWDAEDSRALAEAYYTDCGFGYGETRDGFLWVYDVDAEEVSLHCFGGAAGLIPQDYIDFAAASALELAAEHGVFGVLYGGVRYLSDYLDENPPAEPGRAAADGGMPAWYPDDPEHFAFYHDETAPRVVDDADIFTAAEEQALESRIGEIRRELQRDIVIYTDVSSYGLGKEVCAADFYDFNGYGYGSEREGMCLFVCTDPSDRGWWCCCTGTETMGLYTEYIANLMDDVLYDYMASGLYAAGISDWIENVRTLYRKGSPFAPEWYPEPGVELTPFHDPGAPRVVDDAQLLSESECAALAQQAAAIAEKYGVDVAIHTMPPPAGLNYAEVARTFYRYMGYGYGEDYDGILLTIFHLDGYYAVSRIVAFGSVSKKLSEVNEERLLDFCKDKTDKEAYYDACEQWLRQVGHMERTGRVPRSTAYWALIGAVSLLFGSGFGGVAVGIARHKMAAPREKDEADSYFDSRNSRITDAGRYYLYTATSRRYDPVKKRSSGGGSGGSSYSGSYSGSSGSSHSGSGRSF